MWRKRFDYYMGDVYFTNEQDEGVRELRFVFRTCIDSFYSSKEDYIAHIACRERTLDLAQNYTNYVRPQDALDATYALEAMIYSGTFDFEIPEKYLKSN